MEELYPSASPLAVVEEATEVHAEEVLHETTEVHAEETTNLLVEDLQDAEDPTPETQETTTTTTITIITTRNQMLAANSPKPTSMFPTFLFPSMRRNLGNTSKITRSTN